MYLHRMMAHGWIRLVDFIFFIFFFFFYSGKSSQVMIKPFFSLFINCCSIGIRSIIVCEWQKCERFVKRDRWMFRRRRWRRNRMRIYIYPYDSCPENEQWSVHTFLFSSSSRFPFNNLPFYMMIVMHVNCCPSVLSIFFFFSIPPTRLSWMMMNNGFIHHH